MPTPQPKSIFGEWGSAVLADDARRAELIAKDLRGRGATIAITRSMVQARSAGSAERSMRIGLLASSQGKRLAAEGIQVEQRTRVDVWLKPRLLDWRSGGNLETVQCEERLRPGDLDTAILCWDLDLCRENGWRARRLHGANWRNDADLNGSKERYARLIGVPARNLLIFAPQGDVTNEDPTRPCERYDELAEFLVLCGVQFVL